MPCFFSSNARINTIYSTFVKENTIYRNLFLTQVITPFKLSFLPAAGRNSSPAFEAKKEIALTLLQKPLRLDELSRIIRDSLPKP